MSILDREARADRKGEAPDGMEKHGDRPDELATVRRRFGDGPDSDELAEPPLVLEPDREAGVAVLGGGSEIQPDAVGPIGLSGDCVRVTLLVRRETERARGKIQLQAAGVATHHRPWLAPLIKADLY